MQNQMFWLQFNVTMAGRSIERRIKCWECLFERMHYIRVRLLSVYIARLKIVLVRMKYICTTVTMRTCVIFPHIGSWLEQMRTIFTFLFRIYSSFDVGLYVGNSVSIFILLHISSCFFYPIVVEHRLCEIVETDDYECVWIEWVISITISISCRILLPILWMLG